ncbi:MAG: epoxyqueuosine reductase [Syntrophales bacterium]|nr:epoxyqueuosine reductase [Syntrophales bacterium]
MAQDKEIRENPDLIVSDIIRDFMLHSPENTLNKESGEPAWDEPLIGFSRGDDPLYQEFKDDIGDFLWTPPEIFRKTFSMEPAHLTVISWILPQTELSKEDNRKSKTYPAERWLRSRLFGEQANLALARHTVQRLDEAGIRAVAPELSPLWQWQTSERYGYASNWSNRHAAYAAGLGTFSLCDGLITPKGKAMRCGSVVAEINIEATPRPYNDHRAWCLFYSHNGKCGKCIPRCPVGALSKDGHDKLKCRNYLFDVIADYSKERYGIASYGCGLCQTGVPCESRVPLPGAV